MLRHHVQRNAAAAKRYYQAPDYYAEGSVTRPEFGGRAAERLGIHGPAGREAFERLCDNLHPATGERLTQRTRGGRIVGIDFTFDAPKSLSVLESLTGDERIAAARREASAETMAELERAAAVRVRKRGANENLTTGTLLWYRAEHDTSRPVDGVPDPQPHEHYFVINATWDEAERQWKAANLYDILRDAPYYQAAFHNRLAAKVKALGYEVERKGIAFEVKGLDQSLLDKFSRRTAVIEAEAEEQGITGAKAKAGLGAKTREHKAKNLTAHQLRREWVSRLTDAERRALADVRLHAGEREQAGEMRPEDGRADARAALSHAADHLFERQSAVPARALLAYAMNYRPGAFTVEDAWAELEQGGRFTAELEGRRFAASRAVLAEEERIVTAAKHGHNTLPAIAPAWRPAEGSVLNPEQRAAVAHLLGSRDFVTAVEGDAGAGKTTLLKEAKTVAEDVGYGVHAFAPTHTASRVNLAAEGFDGAETVARLLVDKELQQSIRGQIVLVDEFALLGTKDAAALMKLVKEQEARLWVVADDKQHRAVARGSPFKLLREKGGIKPARVSKIQRQRNAKYRELAELSRDRPAEAVARLQAEGWLVEVPDAERYRLLAADYLEAVKPTGSTALVIAPTHAEGARVTAAIREGLRERKALGEVRKLTRLVPLHLTEAERKDAASYRAGDVIEFTQNAPGKTRGSRAALAEGEAPPAHLAARFQAYRKADLQVAVGDRLRVTAGGATKDGHRLNNGDLITVAGFSKSGDLIDSRGWVIGREFGHLAHGYVTTSVSSQSRTVDHVLVAMGTESAGAINREQLYVSLTRGRHSAKVYTDCAAALAPAVERSDARVSATEVWARRAAEERQRRLTALVLRNRRLDAAAPVPEPHVVDAARLAVAERGPTVER